MTKVMVSTEEVEEISEEILEAEEASTEVSIVVEVNSEGTEEEVALIKMKENIHQMTNNNKSKNILLLNNIKSQDIMKKLKRNLSIISSELKKRLM